MSDASHVDNCVFCKTPDLVFWFSKQAEGRAYPVCKCNSCGSAMLSPRPTQKEMDAYYATADYGLDSLAESLALDMGHYPDSVQDAERIIAHLRAFSKGERFMDVGAGVGFFSREAARQGFSVTALEPNPHSAASFEEQVGFAAVQEAFNENIVELYKDSQDVVLLSQVLEHICDVDSIVDGLSEVLVTGGVATVAVPHFGSLLSRVQGRRDMYISPPEHVNYFSIKGLNALFQRHGFECIDVHTVSKVPREKIQKKYPSILGKLAWRGVYALLKLSELFDRGMIINAYYRKK
jgi:SAM-dependent methyltransferase